MIKKFENMEEVESPCIGVCKIDSKGICEGCKRTANEIRYWWDMNNEEKSKVLKRIKRDNNFTKGRYYGDLPF